MTALQLPLALLAIVWLAVLPMAGIWRWVQAIAVGLGLVALYLAGFWLWPSIWTPHLLIALWFLVAIFGPRRAEGGRRRNWLRGETGAGGGLGRITRWIAILLLGAGAAATWAGLEGRRMPDGPVIDLASPLGPGYYYVAQGGAHGIVNAHLATLGPDLADWRGQSQAVDLVAVDEFGRRKRRGPAEDPQSYRIYGLPVTAPCAGSIVAAEGSRRDMNVPQMDRVNMLGNHVILDCDGTWVVLAHLRPGSLRVTRGGEVAVGDLLGVVGNSGNSAEPHLHIHAQTPGTDESPISGEPVWMRIDGRFPVRGQLWAED